MEFHILVGQEGVEEFAQVYIHALVVLRYGFYSDSSFTGTCTAGNTPRESIKTRDEHEYGDVFSDFKTFSVSELYIF